MDYAVIIEKSELGTFGASVPDLPGCVAVGHSRDEVLVLIREAIELHVEGLKEDGDPIPFPATQAATVRTDVAMG